MDANYGSIGRAQARERSGARMVRWAVTAGRADPRSSGVRCQPMPARISMRPLLVWISMRELKSPTGPWPL